jgi:hypothetical protein
MMSGQGWRQLNVEPPHIPKGDGLAKLPQPLLSGNIDEEFSLCGSSRHVKYLAPAAIIAGTDYYFRGHRRT